MDRTDFDGPCRVAEEVRRFQQTVQGEIEAKLAKLELGRRLAVSAPQLEGDNLHVVLLELGMDQDPPPLVGGWRIYTAPPRLNFLYTNHRQEVAWRSVISPSIRFGSTEWHLDPQWLMRAFDMERRDWREFALNKCSQFFRGTVGG